jgi:hypothetical protein
VAVFDHAYDDLGPASSFEEWPSLVDGEQRNFVVFNDEFVGGSTIAITLTLSSNTTGHVLGAGHLVLNVSIGARVDFVCKFVRSPAAAGEPAAALRHRSATTTSETVDLILTATKNGEEKFQERRRFVMANSSLVTIGCAMSD